MNTGMVPADCDGPQAGLGHRFDLWFNVANHMFTPDTAPSPESGREYKKVVEAIRNLNWESLEGRELQELMQLSYVSALEFAESLRIALKLYPGNEDLEEMAAGELQAGNLSFEDYNGPGDHAEFLAHFLSKNNLVTDENLQAHADAYMAACRALPDEVRAMTIFSREEELSGIFQQILKAKDWSAPGLAAFRYYLASHIEIDSTEGGHRDLTKEFPVNDSVKPFYEARLEMYRAVSRLFEKNEAA